MDARRESVSLFTHTEILNGRWLPHASRRQSVRLSKLGERDERQEEEKEDKEEDERSKG